MNSKNLFRNLVVVAALSLFTGVIAAPAIAQGAKTTSKPAKKSAKKTVAAMYECQHCKEPMTLADAQKKGMKCCGMKMVKVKTAKKTETNKKG
jgi:transcription initiation factor IIE alpha subunit